MDVLDLAFIEGYGRKRLVLKAYWVEMCIFDVVILIYVYMPREKWA